MIINTVGLSLPPQMIPLSKKNDKWKKDNMDALENIGRSQFIQNESLIENYEMLKGKFIYEHYIDRQDYQDLISQLSQEFEIPSHLRHYDIISQVFNTLSGEYQKRPDIFKVKAHDEKAMNNYLSRKKDLLMQYVQSELNAYISERLLAEGLDESRQDFSSQEEQQQFQQIIEQRKEALTPPDIQRYMDMEWMDVSEIWSQHQLEFDKRAFNLADKERVEFEDMLASDRAFRHFYLTPDSNGFNQETWNPINTFFHKSPEVTNIEQGDYVGRVFYLTIPEIINRYGHMMSEEDLLKLEKFKKDSYDAGAGNNFGENYAGLNMKPGTVIPYEDYPKERLVTNVLGTNPINPLIADDRILRALGSDLGAGTFTADLFQVTEAYWMSQEKIGKYVYGDENGEPVTMLVDETFNYKLIPDLEILETSFMEFGNDAKINTLTWTWVNRCYKGKKINNKSLNLSEAIYFDIGINDFQFKGNANIYGAKLPVCGQIFNNRNGESMSLVDLMKPHQIGHNVAMNQLYEIMQREIGRFMLMDTNFIPSNKDWGGEGNFERLMLIAKQLGIAPIDASPSNNKQSNFSHFQMIDLDESARMISRMNIADFFERRALSQVGITPERLGNVAASQSATGTQQAVTQSFAQTESYFTRFSDYKRRCLQMDIEMAQYVQSQKENIQMMYTKADLSRGFVNIQGSEITQSEIGIYVVDSQEAVRQLETIRQLFLNNNTTGATPVDLATVIMSNSPSEIKAQLETSYRLMLEREQAEQQRQADLQQQQIQANQQIAEMQMAKEDERLDKKLANDRYVAQVKAIGTGTVGTGPDANSDGTPDALQIAQFNAELGNHAEDILFQKQQETNKNLESIRKQQLESQKLLMENKKIDQDKDLKEKELKLKEKEMKNNLEIAKYRDKGTKNSPKK